MIQFQNGSLKDRRLDTIPLLEGCLKETHGTCKSSKWDNDPRKNMALRYHLLLGINDPRCLERDPYQRGEGPLIPSPNGRCMLSFATVSVGFRAEDEAIRTLFQVLELQSSDAWSLFSVLDTDGDHRIDAEDGDGAWGQRKAFLHGNVTPGVQIQ